MRATTIIAIVLAGIGLLMIWRGLWHIRRHRHLVYGGSMCLLGLTPIIGGMLIVMLAMALQSYQLLAGEQLAATLTFTETDPQSYRVEYHSAAGDQDTFMLAGDDFRIEAQFIKWKLWTRLLNLQPYYRLERLSGRYADSNAERVREHSVIDLTSSGKPAAAMLPQVDLGQLVRRLPDWLQVLDAEYGSATYMPMRDGEGYRILVTNSGLIARKSTAL